MGEPTAEWAIGDVDAAFGEADVIVEETIVHQSVTHHPMEPRSCMAYWQNGKLFLHGSTQSTERTRGPVAAMAGIDVEDVVMIGEYCGGGFGSKIAGVPIMAVPAVLSRKIGRPVMLRITRYEENYIGRARAGFQGWAKIGFRSDGRMTALDLYLVQDSGAYGASDFFTAGTVATASYQPENMRFRGVPVYTNTPPRSAQRAPGGAQIVAMLEPVVDKAARELGVDRLEIRKV
ncbi:MAG: molybdopterin-dependent oxidoreductase, partial [Gemmatimonadetes bacterium]|nr:molybdopterin-dependent oxidoreductase [Gemmatimonadota bacterium]